MKVSSHETHISFQILQWQLIPNKHSSLNQLSSIAPHILLLKSNMPLQFGLVGNVVPPTQWHIGYG